MIPGKLWGKAYQLPALRTLLKIVSRPILVRSSIQKFNELSSPADISPSLYNLSICSNYGIIDLDSLFKPQVSVLWNILDATGTVVPLPSHFFDTNNNGQNPQKFVLKTTSD